MKALMDKGFKKMWAKCVFALLLALTATLWDANAQDATPTPAPPAPAGADIATSVAFKDFITHYTFAINSKDRNTLRACLHPACLPLLKANTNAADNYFIPRFAGKIPENYKVFTAVLAPEELLPFTRIGMVYPVTPTHKFLISGVNADGAPVNTVAFIAMKDGKWYEVIGSKK